MRKFCFLLVAGTILLMVTSSFAQYREGTTSEAKTSFTNIAVVGLDKDGTDATRNPGVPGYIEMTSTKGSVYYLFIDYDGTLRIASDIVIGQGASPSITAWTSSSGVVVGDQTAP